jgi:hypothetical protein
MFFGFVDMFFFEFLNGKNIFDWERFDKKYISNQ